MKVEIENASEKTKGSRVSCMTAEAFNRTLKEIEEKHTELSGSLPQPIRSTTSFAHMGISDINYIDLAMMVNECLALLNLIGPEE
jgi:hypothetical protein